MLTTILSRGQERHVPQFQLDHSHEDRLREATRVRRSYPTTVPCIVDVAPNNSLPRLDKHKYLVPDDITWAQFLFVLRKRLKLRPEKALFMFANNVLIPSGVTMGEVYKEHKAEDAFLYVSLAEENAFGMPA